MTNIYKNRIQILLATIFAVAFFLPQLGYAAAGVPNNAASTTAERCNFFKSQFNYSSDNGTVPNGNLVTDGGLIGSICTPTDIILKAINLGTAFAGAVAVLFLMLGGYLYLTSAGNEEQSEKGRKIITNSVIGLVIIILSVAIVRIIAGTLSTNFNSPSATPSNSGNNTTNSPQNNNQNSNANQTNNQNPSASQNSTDLITAIDAAGGFIVGTNPPHPSPDATFSLGLSISASDFEKVKQACGDTPLVRVSLVGNSTTKNKTSDGFMQNGSSYLATVNYNANEISAGSYSPKFTVCGTNLDNLAKQTIVVGDSLNHVQ